MRARVHMPTCVLHALLRFKKKGEGISYIEDQKSRGTMGRIQVPGCQNPKAPFQSPREMHNQDRVLLDQSELRPVRPLVPGSPCSACP